MLAELSNLHNVAVDAVTAVGGALVIAWFCKRVWPPEMREPKWLRDLERRDQERTEARRVLVGERARREEKR